MNITLRCKFGRKLRRLGAATGVEPPESERIWEKLKSLPSLFSVRPSGQIYVHCAPLKLCNAIPESWRQGEHLISLT